MAQQNKAPITAFIGALIGLITLGMINKNLSIIGALAGAFIGYVLGKEW